MFQKNIHAKTGERLVQDVKKWLAYEMDAQPGEAKEMGETEHSAGEGQPPRKKDERFTQDVEARLSAYYGPALPAHPLSEDAWLRLRAQLGEPALARRMRWRLPERLSRPARQPVPLAFQQMYATLLLQANYRRPAPALRIRYLTRPVQPRVSTGLSGRGSIKLVLPRAGWQTLQQAELDMLLAAGLARCSEAAHPLSLLPRALFTVSLLFVLAVLPFTSVDRRAVWIFLAALACCLLSGRVLIWQQRLQAFRGDRLAVQWLGRERVCQGLHLLAEHGRPGKRPAWGEPSLAERIARVCGTPTGNKDKRLTLVG
jgi:hypothetical protein